MYRWHPAGCADGILPSGEGGTHLATAAGTGGDTSAS
jgi:hypothetical protein